jgi:hypothetical protein
MQAYHAYTNANSHQALQSVGRGVHGSHLHISHCVTLAAQLAAVPGLC